MFDWWYHFNSVYSCNYQSKREPDYNAYYNMILYGNPYKIKFCIYRSSLNHTNFDSLHSYVQQDDYRLFESIFIFNIVV
jgi:hypothetical protein